MQPPSLHPPPSKLGITLDQHIRNQMAMSPGATGHFTSLLYQIALAAKLVDSQVRKAGLANVLGYTGETNVQGEEVQKLDEMANETFLTVMRRGGRVCAIASEELESAVIVEGNGRYAVTMDPLDGSSNIDVNISIGTIFGIYRRKSDPTEPANDADLLQPGRDLRAAGYIIYGSSTMLVYSTGGKSGVHGFTLDPTIGEFFLSHENIRVPAHGSTYSVNEGNTSRWNESTRRWAEWVKADDKESGRPYGARYVGTLVADAHRTLLKGGIFAYPADRKSPQGKLRLMYEANPFAFLFEAAGGRACDGRRRILDIEPQSLHQRTPLVIGSPDDVSDFERFAVEEAGA
ncbi:MAG: class 1 fructose-bisphosphatase [Deltaproteobacteria bacterium]|nr:class 1 fructose-bisphosphatase [Deltaproteobacteria bacterium]